MKLLDNIINFKDNNDKVYKYVKQFRAKHVPDQYNQIKLLDGLTSTELDHYISISNRADGKSFNYIHFFMNFAIDFGVPFMLLSRMFTVRQSYQDLLEKICIKSNILEPEKIAFIRTQYYVKVNYGNHLICIITDLNSATNLKYSSNFLSEFPIMIYDEFLALEGDYLPDEYARLKTIYGSVNRESHVPFIHYPKLFYLGNAVNFASPVLSNLNLFYKLENHPINTMKQYDNVLLEMNRNDNQNEVRNLRAFDEVNDDMAQGRFHINHHHIATSTDRKAVLQYGGLFHVKQFDDFLKVQYDLDHDIIILAIVGTCEDYLFNQQIKDNTENSLFLDDTYYDDRFEKKHVKGLYRYDNMYTKEQINNRRDLYTLNILKMIRKAETLRQQGDIRDDTERRANLSMEEKTKQSIFKKFLNEY